jgi:CelD/BcsL family acetyltransferase involved in cellulose biosynthesis
MTTTATVRHPHVTDIGSVVTAPEAVQEWNELASRCVGASYFQTADWVCSWWETIARHPSTTVACWRDAEGTLRALAAVSQGREILHRRVPISVPVMSLAGTGPGEADHCGPLVDPVTPERCADVAAWLDAQGASRTFVARSIGSGDIVPAEARLVGRTPCPRLPLERDMVVGRSRNFRTQLDRFTRRLQRAGVTFDWVLPGAVSPEVIDALFSLHRASRDERGARTSLDDAHRVLLHACARRSTDDRGVAAVVARREARIVGVLLGFQLGAWFGAYQSGWDTDYSRNSLGTVLVGAAVLAVAASGGETFDFLRGDEPYKYRFGAVDADDATYVVARGAIGRLLLARAGLKRMVA